ncbi:MAG: methylated-DNA--[protein]-cysteine S-methyltransferase [Gammaproteobacteria bacterium]|nr:methylated-DNA--[protein]-cysteine S-methyltransferase [Gammaproteobacteria bacterium]
MSADATHFTHIDTPLGPLLAAGRDGALFMLEFGSRGRAPRAAPGWIERPAAPLLRAARRQLDGYFAGRRRDFDLPLCPEGTPFQQLAWQALRQIPYGETRSYGQQAALLGRPRAARAVGAANGRNPIVIMIPCHRVIGSGGALTGFAAGLDRKARLLRLEGAMPGAQA